MRPALPRGQAGFSLVEMLVALSVFLLILMGIFQVFDPSNTAYMVSERKLDVQQNARVAMDIMTRQIRMAGFFPENFDTNPANDQANKLEIATNAALAVAGDLDGSGSTSAFFFCLDSGGLKVVKGARGVAGSYTCSSGNVLAESVTSLGFAYYDTNNAALPNPPTAPYQLDNQPVGAAPSFATTTSRGAVQRIVITLTAQETIPNQPAQNYTLTSDVRLRNP